MFHSMNYVRVLEEAGFSREQSETSVGVMMEIMNERLASKQDLKELETRVLTDVQLLRLETQHWIERSEARMTIRMGTMLAASIAILTAIQKLV